MNTLELKKEIAFNAYNRAQRDVYKYSTTRDPGLYKCVLKRFKDVTAAFAIIFARDFENVLLESEKTRSGKVPILIEIIED